jgi:hypothetical protein
MGYIMAGQPAHMIKFNCRCSHTFIVEDDQAGASMQCPACGLLVDVPTLSDLPNLSADGTYTLSDYETPAEPDRFNTLYRSFTRDHVDPGTGEEIDLRLDQEDMEGARVDPLHLKDDPRPARPKYDPVTGELIRPLDVEGGDDAPSPAAIPMAQSVVSYATAYTQSVPSAWSIAVELLMPINVAVMFFVALAYMLGHVFMLMRVLFFVTGPIAALLLAHYGNVIEEIGPELKDELPRPLRHAAMMEDLWWPFFRMFGSILLCYGPAIAVLMEGLPPVMALFVAAAGSVALPAVMLTATTSGTIQNLRPDRVFTVIGIIGPRYFIAVAVWLAALVLSLWTWFGVILMREMIDLGMLGEKWRVLHHPLAIYPLIAVAIYLMHYYCWYLAVLYRRHQHEFPWVLQRHIPNPDRLGGRTRRMPYGPPKGRRPVVPRG